MELLGAGLALFVGLHMVPGSPRLRAALQGRLGARRYRLVFGSVALVSLAMVVAGHARAPRGAQLWVPSPGLRAAAPGLLLLAFALVVAAPLHGYLRRWLRHPLPLGLALWAVVHLLVTGHSRAVLLFGALLGMALAVLTSRAWRALPGPCAAHARDDLLALGAGALAVFGAGLVHHLLFGVAPVPWSL